jgi:cell division protein FtsL
LGPALSALGAASLWGVEVDPAERTFYQWKDDYEDEMTRRGAKDSSPDTQTGEKAELITRNMKAADFSRDEISVYLQIVETDKELRKLDEDFRKEYNDLRYGDEEGWEYAKFERSFKTLRKNKLKLMTDAVKKINRRDRTTF